MAPRTTRPRTGMKSNVIDRINPGAADADGRLLSIRVSRIFTGFKILLLINESAQRRQALPPRQIV